MTEPETHEQMKEREAYVLSYHSALYDNATRTPFEKRQERITAANNRMATTHALVLATHGDEVAHEEAKRQHAAALEVARQALRP